MTLKSSIQSDFAKIMGNHSNAKVLIANGANTLYGFRYDIAVESELDDSGERGNATGIVLANTDSLGTVERGQELVVDGTTMFTMSVESDSVGAITKITYTQSRPI